MSNPQRAIRFVWRLSWDSCQCQIAPKAMIGSASLGTVRPSCVDRHSAPEVEIDCSQKRLHPIVPQEFIENLKTPNLTGVYEVSFIVSGSALDNPSVAS